MLEFLHIFCAYLFTVACMAKHHVIWFTS